MRYNQRFLEELVQIRIRLFAQMAQQAGVAALAFECAPETPLGAVRSLLRERFPKLPWPEGTLLAVNQEYVPESTPLREGDEVAIIPPVSGGSKDL